MLRLIGIALFAHSTVSNARLALRPEATPDQRKVHGIGAVIAGAITVALLKK